MTFKVQTKTFCTILSIGKNDRVDLTVDKLKGRMRLPRGIML